MPLFMLIFFYLAVAGCEVAFPEKCLSFFEKLIKNEKLVRFSSIFAFFIAFLYYAAEPQRLQWLITALLSIYALSGIWFLAHPQSVISLFKKSYGDLEPEKKRVMLYADCTMRTILALLLIFSL